MLPNNDSSASSTGAQIHKKSTAIPYTSTHLMHDETLIALGFEMIDYVVGPNASLGLFRITAAQLSEAAIV